MKQSIKIHQPPNTLILNFEKPRDVMRLVNDDDDTDCGR